MQRVCRRCKIDLPHEAFGNSSRNRDGKQTICKQCDVAAVQASRKRKAENQAFPIGWQRKDCTERLRILNEQYIKKQCATGDKMVQEAKSIDLFEAAMPHWEVRRWQDATKSDVGVRPKDSTVDLWLPLQMKSSSSAQKRFMLKSSHNRSLPNCDVVCIVIEPFSMLFIPRGKLESLKISPTGHWSVTSAEVRNPWVADPLCLNSTLEHHYSHHALFSEDELRMQVNSKYLVEMLNIKYANILLPESHIEWPSMNNGCTDLIRDGKREQHKSALPNGNSFDARHCWKKMCNVQVAYEVGDNDFYVFGYLQPHVFIQWRIPEVAMIDHDMLSFKNEQKTTFVNPGRECLRLHIVDSHGNHKNDQLRIFGKLPNADSDSWTGQYVSVLWL